MRGWSLAAGVFALAVLGLGVAGAVLLLRGGMSSRSEPSAAEARIARTLRGWAMPSRARDAKNPVPRTPQALAAGLSHFADHCASCHANDGSGNTAIGRTLYPRAPDMRRRPTQALTDGELFHIIENGVRFTGMPAWGGSGTAEGSWHLVHFIRHLPELTADEKVQMEALNPRSPAEFRALQEEDAFLHGEERPPREPGHGPHTH
jgi:mono/diheme cytochrome c family protein